MANELSKGDVIGVGFGLEDKATPVVTKLEKVFNFLFQSLEKGSKTYHKTTDSTSASTAKLSAGLEEQGAAWKNELEGVKGVGEWMPTLKPAEESVAEAVTKHSDAQEHFHKKAEKAAHESGHLHKELDALKDASKEAAEGIAGTSEALSLMWKVLTGGLIVGAIVAVIEFFTKAGKAAEKLAGEVAGLNKVYLATRTEAREVSAAVLSISDSMGISREQALDTVKALEDLGNTPRAAHAAGASLAELTRITGEFEAATGVSVDSAANLTDQLMRINRIPTTALRGMEFTIKNIADNSHITTDELLRMNKSLEDVFAHMKGKDHVKFTKEMLGIAGALSDINVDASKMSEVMADALDISSQSGIDALNNLSAFTRIGSPAMKEMLKNNPAQVIQEIAKRAAELDPNTLMQFASEMKPLGLNYAQLTRLAEQYGDSSKESFVDRVKDLEAENAKQDKLRAAAEATQAHLHGIMEGFKREWDELLIKVGGPLLHKVIVPMMNKLANAIKRMVDYLKDVDWDKVFNNIAHGAQVAFEAISTVIGWIEKFQKKPGAGATTATNSPELGFLHDDAKKQIELENKGFVPSSTSARNSPELNFLRGPGSVEAKGEHARMTNELMKENIKVLKDIHKTQKDSRVHAADPKVAAANALVGAL